MIFVQFPSFPNINKHYKFKNIAAALAVCLLLIVWLTASCSNRVLERNKPQNKTNVVASSDKKTAKKKNEQKQKRSFRYEEVDNRQVSKGSLVLVNSDHKLSTTEIESDTLYSYLFSESGTQIMSASTTELIADADALEALRKMMTDYYAKTSDNSVIVYSTTENPDGSATGFTESPTGLCFDLLGYDAASGSYPPFTGEGSSAWVPENCAKYGMILRYPDDKVKKTGQEYASGHYRYVGEPHSEIMAEKSMCLEEYLEFIKKYSFEKPLSYTTYDGRSYEVWYVKEGKDRTTKLPILQKADGKDYAYTVSGNNYDGFIVTVCLSEEAPEVKTGEDNDDSSSLADGEQDAQDGTGQAQTDDYTYDYTEDYTAEEQVW